MSGCHADDREVPWVWWVSWVCCGAPIARAPARHARAYGPHLTHETHETHQAMRREGQGAAGSTDPLAESMCGRHVEGPGARRPHSRRMVRHIRHKRHGGPVPPRGSTGPIWVSLAPRRVTASPGQAAPIRYVSAPRGPAPPVSSATNACAIQTFGCRGICRGGASRPSRAFVRYWREALRGPARATPAPDRCYPGVGAESCGSLRASRRGPFSGAGRHFDHR